MLRSRLPDKSLAFFGLVAVGCFFSVAFTGELASIYTPVMGLLIYAWQRNVSEQIKDCHDDLLEMNRRLDEFQADLYAEEEDGEEESDLVAA